MLTFHPSTTHLLNDFRQISSQHVGICESRLNFGAQMGGSPTLQTLTTDMPNYHRSILSANSGDMEHHLAGYGMYRQEGMVRILGEGIERYALMISAQCLKSKFFEASYNDLKSDSGTMPWEYINIFSGADYQKFEAAGMRFRPITPDTKISWMWCPSLFKPGKETCVPVQFLFTVLPIKETRFVTGFSKGTAAHRTVKRALRAAILESVEADATTCRWFAKMKCRRVVVDDPVLQRMTADLFGDYDPEMLVSEYTMPDMPGHGFAVALLAKGLERPTVLLGTGAGLEPIGTLYRTLTEALAIHVIGRNGPVITPRDHLVPVSGAHKNLDTNVGWWASTDDADMKKDAFRKPLEGEVKLSTLPDFTRSVDEDLEYLLQTVGKVSQYGVCMDITPPEVRDAGWTVQRVFFPELVQMAMPSSPYSNHPRLLQYGGVQNDLPHASP